MVCAQRLLCARGAGTRQPATHLRKLLCAEVRLSQEQHVLRLLSPKALITFSTASLPAQGSGHVGGGSGCPKSGEGGGCTSFVLFALPFEQGNSLSAQ